MKYLTPVLLIFLVIGCKPPEVPVQVQKDIDSIAFKYVPDKREGVCDLNLEFLNDKMLLIKGETNIPEAKNEIINYIADSGIEYYDSLKVIPDPDEIDRPWGIVSVSV